MKKIVFLISVLVTFTSCKSETSHVLEGVIQPLGLAENQSVYVYQFGKNQLVAIDSSTVDINGKFKIDLKDTNVGVFYFGSSNVNSIPLVIKESTDKIEINIKNNQQFSLDYNIKGSDESQQISKFYKRVFEMMKFNQEINMKMQQLAPDNTAGKEILQRESIAASQEFVKFRDQYIKDNKGTEALIVALEQIRPETEFELFKEVASDLTSSLPESQYVKSLNSYVSQLEQQKVKQQEQERLTREKMETLIPIGGQAPELDFPNPKGKNIKLSSLRGKVVLIDFWASWCGPCRRENPNVVKLYNKYKNKGFDIYSFSLDEKKENWEKAIKADGLSWKNHVSDLKKWRSEALNLYGFNGIPFTVLIDREGKIVERNLRGEELEAALKRIL